MMNNDWIRLGSGAGNTVALVLFGYPGMPGTRRGTVQRQISFHTDAASRYALYYTPAQELLMSVTAIGRKNCSHYYHKWLFQCNNLRYYLGYYSFTLIPLHLGWFIHQVPIWHIPNLWVVYLIICFIVGGLFYTIFPLFFVKRLFTVFLHSIGDGIAF